MAKWRAVYADISTSGQVNKLSEFEQLLFTWMIPHADDWGVLTGDPVELKLKVMPGSSRQIQEMSDALRHIEEMGLIWQYEPNGSGPLIQFCKWDEYQPIRKDKRRLPSNPLYDGKVPEMAGIVGLDKTRQDIDKTRIDQTTTDQTTTDKEVSVAVVPDSDVLTRLECLGIAGPVCKELALLQHVTCEYLEDWRVWIHDGKGKNLKNVQGYLVTRIREGSSP